MTQTLDFSNQDLRDRSFRGLELAGANFFKADIRGCDFRNTNLEGTNFSGVTAGLSNKQIMSKDRMIVAESVIAIAYAFAAALCVWVFVPMVGAITSNVFFEVFITISWLYFIFFDYLQFSYSLLIFCGCELLIIKQYWVILIPFLFYCFMWYSKGADEKSKNETGTSFSGAKLIDAKFSRAILENCDFRFANLYRTDWLHANFNRCKFSGKFDNQLVRDLCVARIGIDKDYSAYNLSGLNLVGANLRGANLAIANLNETNLSEAILENTNFCDVQAIKTDFTNATLTGACIENWAITSETIFTNVKCSHIFLDIEKKQRQPSIGSFSQSDFEKLVLQLEKI